MEKKVEKWEDTLISEPKIFEIQKACSDKFYSHGVYINSTPKLLEAQAKFTWDVAFEAGSHAGNKEVVEC